MHFVITAACYKKVGDLVETASFPRKLKITEWFERSEKKKQSRGPHLKRKKKNCRRAIYSRRKHSAFPLRLARHSIASVSKTHSCA